MNEAMNNNRLVNVGTKEGHTIEKLIFPFSDIVSFIS